ncbi:uncharacterized protein LOC112683795 isoform X2 [Sipha flava]|uniref:Uncharacterized protein LOC112683795 isoform X2 n=1 Tax=Sipha flava TaxID=143950 RepID=A0A8B8FJ81_9HEMI|nr:uncharacterized protein LOC112683795 isoform X2 [Sipha flava]
MKDFLEWVRKCFLLVDMMHLADVDDETLQVLMFQNGSSRDELIKLLVYKLLLDIDSEGEDIQKHNIEKVLVTFGLLNKEVTRQFLNGSMPTKLHVATWKRIIEAMVPNTTIESEGSSYDELMNYIFNKDQYFQSVKKKNYLPPELIPKLKVKTNLNEITESIEETTDKLIEILNKPIKTDIKSDNKTVSYYEEHSSNHDTFEFMDLISIKKDIEEYIKISTDNKITSLNSEQPVKMSPQQFLELTMKQNLIHTDNFESKIEDIAKLVKAEQDLHILTNSLADQLSSSTDVQM